MSTHEEKPDVTSLPSTPKKGKKTSDRSPITPNKSPGGIKPKGAEMQAAKQAAVAALFEFAVKGTTADIVAEKSGLTKRQLKDLFRPDAKNFGAKMLSQID